MWLATDQTLWSKEGSKPDSGGRGEPQPIPRRWARTVALKLTGMRISGMLWQKRVKGPSFPSF